MQVIKDVTEGLLFSPICLSGKWFLQIAVLHYFDLMAPDEALSEQDLWVDILPELGEGNFLDPGYPKVRGEVLLAGSWHSQDGTAKEGGRVFFSVGDVSRELLVFGPRYWQAGPSGYCPGAAEPVKSVRLAWENAFGGEGFDENPNGLGYIHAETPWGEERRYLPLIEDPATGLVGAPDDTPHPAHTGVCVLDAPSRIQHAGTYGDSWLKSYWPGFPPDVHDDFFQLAAESQRLKEGWFKGGEAVVLEGLHPRFPRIETRLPRKRVRVFAAKVPKPEKPEEQEYIEAATRLETVWLFPGIMRGVALHRALLETVDDEASDFVSLFPVMEATDAPLTDLHYWREEQMKRTAAPAKPDPAPLEEAKKVVENVKAAIRAIEADAHFTVDKVLGLAPIFDIPTSQQFSLYRKVADDALKLVDNARKTMSEARKEYSHVMKIDPRVMDGVRKTVLDSRASLDAMERGILKAKADAGQAKKDMLAGLDEFERTAQEMTPQGEKLPLPPEDITALLATHRALLDPPPSWNTAALDLVAAHLCAMNGTEELFVEAGLAAGASLRSGFGVLPDAARFSYAAWGLEAPGGAVPGANAPEFAVPGGYIIPWFNGKECVRLALRHPASDEECAKGAKPEDGLFAPCAETLFPGSGEGLQLLGGHSQKPLLVTPDPVAAWLYYAEVSDIFTIAVVTSPAATPEDSAAQIIANAPLALLPLSPAVFPPRTASEEDDVFAARVAAAAADYAKLFPGLVPVAWDATFSAPHVAAAKRKGLELRAWLKEELRLRSMPVPSAEEEGGLTAELDENGVPGISLAMPKIPADLHSAVSGRVNAHVDAVKKERLAEISALEKEHKAAFAGKESPFVLPDLTATSQSVLSSPAVAAVDDDFAALQAAYEQTKALPDIAQTPGAGKACEEAQKALAVQQAEFKQALADIKTQLGKGEAILKNPLAELAPDWVKDVPGAAAVLSPEPMTPELALAKLTAGETYGLSLKDVNLSGKDLSGVVFREMFLDNVNFSGANLSGARFESVMADKVNFTGANLSGSEWKLCSLAGGIFAMANCRGMRGELLTLTECSFAMTQLEEAKLKLSSFVSCTFTGRIAGLSLELYNLDGEFTDALFDECSFIKGATVDSFLSGVLFRDSVIREASFIGCKGNDVRLTSVKAENIRFVASNILRLHCVESDLSRASFRESHFPSALFTGCNMRGICIEQCDLSGATFSQCKAPGGVIRHSNLEGASLVRFSIPGGSLRKSRLVRANLAEANLYGTDMYKVVLGESLLAGANLTNTLLHGAEGLLVQEGYASEEPKDTQR